jgi:hypothetical protein
MGSNDGRAEWTDRSDCLGYYIFEVILYLYSIDTHFEL